MKVLLTIILTLLGVYIVSTALDLRKEPIAVTAPHRLETPQPSPSVRPEPTSASEVFKPRSVGFSGIWLVRGTVVGVTSRGPLIRCELEGSRGRRYTAGMVGPTSGAADVRQAVQLAIDQENKIFGSVLRLKDGKLVSGLNPKNKAIGDVLLQGHPNEETMIEGQAVNVVAVPESEISGPNARVEVYTMNFIYCPEKGEPGSPCSWMYERGRTMLDGGGAGRSFGK